MRRPAFDPHVAVGIALDGRFKVTGRPAHVISGNPSGHFETYDEARLFADRLAERFNLPVRHRDGLQPAPGTRGE